MRAALAVVGLLLLWGAAPVYGSGNSLSAESSARTLGSAGAGKEALSDSTIGVFTNPALGAGLEGTTLAVSGTYLTGDSTFDVTTNLGGRSTGDDFVPDAFLGTLVVNHAFSADLAIGFTAGPGFGLAVDYPETWSAGALVTEATLQQFAISPVLSWQLSDFFSIGVAPIIEVGALDYASNTPFGRVVRSYDKSIAFGVLLGAYFSLPSETEVGLTFRLSPDHSYRGRRTGLLPSSSAIDIDSPNVVSLGLRHHLTSDFTVLASTSWFSWSGTRQHIIVEPGAGNTVIPRNWDDGWQFALGFEYDVSHVFSVRSGFAYSNKFISSSHLVPDAPFDAQRRFGAGLTYRLPGGESWDFAYGFNDLGENALALSAADFGGVAAQGRLDVTGHVFSLQYNARLDDFFTD